MSINPITVFLLALAGAALGTSEALASTVTITNANHVGGPPQTVKPQGTYSVPTSERSEEWQIRTEIGYFSNGGFVKLQDGDITTLTGTIPTNGVGNWAQAAPTTISTATCNTLPNGSQLYIRAYLERKYGPVFVPRRNVDEPFGVAKNGADPGGPPGGEPN